MGSHPSHQPCTELAPCCCSPGICPAEPKFLPPVTQPPPPSFTADKDMGGNRPGAAGQGPSGEGWILPGHGGGGCGTQPLGDGDRTVQHHLHPCSQSHHGLGT